MSLKQLNPAIIIYRHAPNEKDLSEELTSLVTSCGYTPIKMFKQTRPVSVKYNLGRGKVLEIKDELMMLDASIKDRLTIIFGNDLTPTQKFNLETEFDIEIIDKTTLILEIFEQRASSEEAKLQVSLARSKYNLAFQKANLLHSIGQRFGTERRGYKQLGESKITVFETGYRRQQAKIEQRLERLEKYRVEQRKQQVKDTGVNHYTVSLVGYTSSGKSTLLNALAGSQVPTSAQLFTTLAPATRRVFIKNTLLLVSDTVGFLDGLPTSLIEAFRSTLEASTQAHVLILILDVSDPIDEIDRKLRVVINTLSEIGATNRRQLIALNKSDLVPAERIQNITQKLKKDFGEMFSSIFPISALNKDVSSLKSAILSLLPEWKYEANFALQDSSYPKWRSFIYNNYHVERDVQNSDGKTITIIFTTRTLINHELSRLENIKLLDSTSTDLSPLLIQ
ncbi:MAG: GTPase HflX [Promethearchaeota archaeon]